MTGVVNCRRVATHHDESTYFVKAMNHQFTMSQVPAHMTVVTIEMKKAESIRTVLILGQIKIRYIARWENDVFQLIVTLLLIFCN